MIYRLCYFTPTSQFKTKLFYDLTDARNYMKRLLKVDGYDFDTILVYDGHRRRFINTLEDKDD